MFDTSPVLRVQHADACPLKRHALLLSFRSRALLDSRDDTAE